MSQRKEFFKLSLKKLKSSDSNFHGLQQQALEEQQHYGQHRIPGPATFTKCQIKICPYSKSIYPDDVDQFLTPVSIYGDGNCLFRSLSYLMFKNEDHHVEMRCRCVVELAVNIDYYLNNENLPGDATNKLYCLVVSTPSYDKFQTGFRTTKVQRQVVEEEIKRCCRLNGWASMLFVLGLSSVVGHPLMSIYPKVGSDLARKNILQLVIPRQKSSNQVLSIMWTRCSTSKYRGWEPNHFVACVALDDSDDKSRKRKAICVGKSTKAKLAAFSFRHQTPGPPTPVPLTLVLTTPEPTTTPVLTTPEPPGPEVWPSFEPLSPAPPTPEPTTEPLSPAPPTPEPSMEPYSPAPPTRTI